VVVAGEEHPQQRLILGESSEILLLQGIGILDVEACMTWSLRVENTRNGGQTNYIVLK